MKRGLILILVVIGLLSLAGCGSAKPANVSGTWLVEIGRPGGNIDFAVLITQSGAGLTASAKDVSPCLLGRPEVAIVCDWFDFHSLPGPSESGRGTMSGNRMILALTDGTVSNPTSGCVVTVQAAVSGNGMVGSYTAANVPGGNSCQLTSGTVTMKPLVVPTPTPTPTP